MFALLIFKAGKVLNLASFVLIDFKAGKRLNPALFYI